MVYLPAFMAQRNVEPAIDMCNSCCRQLTRLQSERPLRIRRVYLPVR
jgi:hypothetical protein